LLGLGHRRIGFVTGAPGSSQAAERLRSYKEVLQEHGLYQADLIAQGNFTQRGGFVAAQHLLALPEPPSAIFAASDATAFGVIDAIKDKGLRVPDDVSVVGFDDIPAASQIHPALTTVRHPVQAMAKAAIQLLLDGFAEKPTRDTITEFPSELVIRESTAPHR
jgi:LacI family transcriptional regulator